jgi:hypothetical protein
MYRYSDPAGDFALDIDQVLDPEAQRLVARLREVVNEGMGRAWPPS